MRWGTLSEALSRATTSAGEMGSMKMSKLVHHFFHSMLVLGVLALTSQRASAQSVYGSIRGLVTDPSTSIVANAKVYLINEGTSEQRNAISNNLSEYEFRQVIPGSY